MARFPGSAAIVDVFAMPQSAARDALLRCIARLRHTVALAEIAAAGAEPEIAAHYIIDTVDELNADLRALRAALHRFPS